MTQFTAEQIMANRAALPALAKADIEADILVRGQHAPEDPEAEFRGCSIGCLGHHFGVHPGNHKAVMAAIGAPEGFGHLQDAIFENVRADQAPEWHQQVCGELSNLPVDFDWDVYWHVWSAEVLEGIALPNAGETEDAIKAVIDLHRRAANGDGVTAEEWSAARSAAWSTAWRQIAQVTLTTLREGASRDA